MSEINQILRVNSKGWEDRQGLQGLTRGPGPYIGVVKNNRDPTYSGRLMVYIDSMGSVETKDTDQNDITKWIPVSYASPFRGRTQGKVLSLNEYTQKSNYNEASASEENSFQSYGFWMTPPDIGSRVLVIFVEGKLDQGYWFACLGEGFSSHMTPGIGAQEYFWSPGALATHSKLTNYIELPWKETPVVLPVVEAPLDEQKTGDVYKENPQTLTRYPHVFQSMRLGIQGLCFDAIRGTVSSSSLRETPSRCLGISSPGRFWSDADKEQNPKDPNFLKNFRLGGHQFVMDDGDAGGTDQIIRIRSSKGNMILLDDTNEQIYVVNARGTAWIELTPSGRIDIYADSDFSVRSKGDINFLTEKDFNIHSRGNVQIKSDKEIRVESIKSLKTNNQDIVLYGREKIEIGSSDSLNISSSLMKLSSASKIDLSTPVVGLPITVTPSPGVFVREPSTIRENLHTETINLKANVWWYERSPCAPIKYKSIVSRATAHEPWKDHEVFGIRRKLC